MRVIVGGSRRLSRLSRDVQARLNVIVDQGMTVLVGDANGADRVIQEFFARKEYPKVEVYCMDGHPRNNVGGWKIVGVASNRVSKDFTYYAQKDARMCKDADCGFLIWDGRSKGTLNNVLTLLEYGKKMRLYFSPDKSFHLLASPEDVRRLLEGCNKEDIGYFDRSLELDERLNALITSVRFENANKHPV
jgi:hypothetical protein